jgi:GNAT superfamily N-acetyltransferase
MSKLIDDLSSDGLFAAQEANMAAFWLAYGRGPGCSVSSDPNAAWFYTGVPYPLFNGVARARLQPRQVQPVIDILSGHIGDRGAPGLWWVGPQSTPADLGETLQQSGMQPIGETPAMALDLRSLPDAPEPTAGLTVERVRGPDMQALWARTAGVGTEAPQEAVDALARLEATLADPGYANQRRYVGFLDGVPVASAALVLESGVAGIYAVATIESARRRGIGRHMTELPLIEARDELGYRVAILQSSSMGRSVYAGMGFTEIGKYQLYMQTA